MLTTAAIFSVSSGLGYALPAIIGLESMGVPSPGETALVAAAVLASQGHLKIWLVILTVASSAIVGDNVGYLLGRRLGRHVLISRWPVPRAPRERVVVGRQPLLQTPWREDGLLGRWIAWIRFATAWLAGINHMPFRVFFPWNAFGGITWAVTYGLLGYYGGQAVVNVAERVGIVRRDRGRDRDRRRLRVFQIAIRLRAPAPLAKVEGRRAEDLMPVGSAGTTAARS